MIRTFMLALLLTLSLSACKRVEPRITVDNGYMNVRDMGDSYVHYEIMDGDSMITCRERQTHYVHENNLTCWPTIETYPDEGF